MTVGVNPLKDILVNIIDQLTIIDIGHANQVSKVFLQIFNQNVVWQHLLRKNYLKDLDSKSIQAIKFPKDIFKLLFGEKNNLVEMDTVKSLADNGDPYCQFILGRQYYWSEPSEEIVNESIRYFELSRQQGMTYAHYYLGLSTRHTQKELAFECFLAGAQNGDMHSEYHLAICYEDGIGVQPNEEEAKKFFRKAAEKGHASAEVRYQYYLGLDYMNSKDYANAFNAFYIGAKDGEKDCEYWAGFCLEKGIGVSADPKRALLFYKSAAKQGHFGALTRLNKEDLERPTKKQKTH